MLMFNIQKAKNFGTIIRSAAAFNLQEVFLVEAANKKNKIATFGSQGTATKMDMRFFPSTESVRNYCTEQKISICGIEITPDSKPIQEHPFRGDTLFLLGNEGSGLNSTQIEMCDHFVYIPQYTDKTASLNVAIAGSIIFHHFAIYAKYQEAGRQGEKFDVSYYEQGKDTKRIIMGDGQQEDAGMDQAEVVRNSRKAQREEMEEVDMDFDGDELFKEEEEEKKD